MKKLLLVLFVIPNFLLAKEQCEDMNQPPQEFKGMELITFKKYKILPNSCLIILNVPWAYHSVKKYIGNKDRKYFYMVYDFPIKNTGSNAKNRKKGFNGNIFWKQKVKVQSSKMRNVFLSERETKTKINQIFLILKKNFSAVE